MSASVNSVIVIRVLNNAFCIRHDVNVFKSKEFISKLNNVHVASGHNDLSFLPPIVFCLMSIK